MTITTSNEELDLIEVSLRSSANAVRDKMSLIKPESPNRMEMVQDAQKRASDFDAAANRLNQARKQAH